MFRQAQGAALLLTVWAAPLAGQTLTTGALEGQVLSSAGMPIAGADVILTSSQIARRTRTDDRGRFRFNLLAPGAWRATVVHRDFQTLAVPFVVALNETRNATFHLSSFLSATVEITDRVSTVDTTTAQVGTTLEVDTLAALPIGRDVNDLMLLAPTVMDGGFSWIFRANDPSISGASAAENQYIVDGLLTTDFRYGNQSAVLPPEFVDQAEIQTGGFKPEYSALGGVFNLLLKSGTNAFQGSAWVTWDPYNGFARPKQNRWFVAPDNQERYDAGFVAGGPLLKDRIFYFVGVDGTWMKGHAIPNYSGQVSDPQRFTDWNAMLKLNGFLTPSQQLTMTCRYDGQVTDQGSAYGAYGPGQEGARSRNSAEAIALTYDSVLTSDVFLTIKLGRNALPIHTDPKDGADMLVYDQVQNNGAGTFYGGYGAYQETNAGVSLQAKADLTWIAGRHTLKFGVNYLQSKYYRNDRTSGPYGAYLIVADPTLIVENFYEIDSYALAKYRGVYAQDSWEAGHGLMAAFGFRFETQEQYGAGGYRIFKFDRPGDCLQPRLSLVWDLNQDGKSKLFANYGVYFENVPQRLALGFGGTNINTSYYFVSPTFSYDPANPNHYGTVAGGIYSSPQGNGGPGPTAIFAQNWGPRSQYDPIENGIRLPRRIEFTLGYERQVTGRSTVGIHGKYRKLTRIMEDSALTDTGGNPVDGSTGPYSPHFIIWNPGPGPVSYSTNASGDLNPHAVYLPSTLFPTPYNLYRSVDLDWDWKGERSTLAVNYTWSRLFGNYEGVVSSSNGQAMPNATTAFDYWSYYGTGLLPMDRTHMLKFFGSTRIPSSKGAWNLGFNFRLQSGVPISLWDDGSTTHGKPPGYDTQYNTNHPGVPGPGTVAATAADFSNPAYWSGQPVGSTPPNGGTFYTGPGYPSLDMGSYSSNCAANFKQGNYGRTQTVTRLDLHVDHDWPLAACIHFVPGLDVFNVLDTRAVQSVNLQATSVGAPYAGWNQPSSYQPGRFYRLSMKVKF